MTSPQTLFDKIWQSHLFDVQDDGVTILYIDRHLIHEVTSPQAFEQLRLSRRAVRRPERTVATPDHNVPTSDRSLPIADETSRRQVDTLRENCHEAGIRIYDLDNPQQGIVHIIGPSEKNSNVPNHRTDPVRLLTKLFPTTESKGQSGNRFLSPRTKPFLRRRIVVPFYIFGMVR